MMNFRIIKDNLVQMLGKAANRRFTVFGYQNQSIGATEILGDNRRVQVFYDSGDFPKEKAAPTSKVYHEIRFRIELAVSAASEGNLAVINDENSNAAQVAAAIGQFQTAASIADSLMDEFFEIIFQIIMDARNVDIGTDGPPFIVSDRWVNGFQKGNTVPQGEFVVLTGNIDFTCQVIETVTGDKGTEIGSGPYNQTLDIDGDDSEKTGVIV